MPFVRGFCSRFVGKSVLSTHLFALKNVVMSNYSLEKVCLSLNYSLEKMYSLFCGIGRGFKRALVLWE